MRYAVNLIDLTRICEPEPKGFCPVRAMLAPVTKGREIAKVGPDLDDSAVVLECGPKRALSILSWLKGRGKVPYPRGYVEGPKGGWKEVSRDKEKLWKEAEKMPKDEGVPA